MVGARKEWNEGDGDHRNGISNQILDRFLGGISSAAARFALRRLGGGGGDRVVRSEGPVDECAAPGWLVCWSAARIARLSSSTITT